MTSTWIIWIGLAVALLYLPMTSNPASWPRSVVKTVPLLCFALAAYVAGGAAFLVAGLFLSALGDFALSRRGEGAFLYGLSAFALAHLVYILHLTGLSGQMPWEAFALFPLLALFLIALTLSAELWLIPHVGGLRWPVRAYVLVITGMGLAALTLPVGPVTLGAGLFILSDLILAVQLFRMGEDHPLVNPAGWVLWTCYVLGQALILTGGLP
ncbi:lysoplasmalogenase [Aliiroseovarius subalbicans]|uniref:lysoplasmalogenase n=1 Tax=Aliiroseovarius subalbicans TaxID=2925840 RepID=UPI001F597C06|nr:lysoplasmalogenase [Aliiroseovarius subalbicans]MCI2399331.1 lysoplasmalogenase [Aliiroseovarius subalbicans]